VTAAEHSRRRPAFKREKARALLGRGNLGELPPRPASTSCLDGPPRIEEARQGEVPMFSTARRARWSVVAISILAMALVLPGTSCGGGGSNGQAGGGSDGGLEGGAGGDGPTAEGAPSGDGPGGGTVDPCASGVVSSGSSALTAVWANEGGDKVTRDELRATGHEAAVANSVWDGHCIRIFAAKNEVVSFNLVLEAATTAAAKVSVSLSDLSGPAGSAIRSAQRTADHLFDWTTTESELFYVRYLQIKGLSQQAYGTLATWQEATFPKGAQCPGMQQSTPDSIPTGTGCAWAQRPVADRFVPDVAVPLELVPSFDVAASSNQSIWADVYVPKSAASGVYGGAVTIRENGAVTRTVPVALTVRKFTLPDAPSSKTMLFTSYGDVSRRYTSVQSPSGGSPQDVLTQTVLKNQRLLAHRHRISLIGDDANQTGTQPGSDYVPVLTGTFFSAANGYAGPGTGTGQDVYSIGTYGSMTSGSTQAQFTSDFDGWETWFEASSPSTERFVYLCDEIDCQHGTPDLPTQLQWWSAITGPGGKLHTMATQDLLGAPATLSDPTSSWPFSIGTPSGNTTVNGTTAADQAAVAAVLAAEPARRLFSYNGSRPGAGSIATEDDGVALREQPWGQYKKGIDRWFWWEATYYNDFQAGLGEVDLFASANTFGTAAADTAYGTSGGANGNGLLFYPGTDALFPSSSYGLAGPIASLRLKHWRRGIQDVDYLTLAAAKDSTSVQSLVNKVVPSVLWEVQCHDPVSDCSYSYAPISWSRSPDDWESARAALAHIIDGQ
jgi:hypothetical protein